MLEVLSTALARIDAISELGQFLSITSEADMASDCALLTRCHSLWMMVDDVRMLLGSETLERFVVLVDFSLHTSPMIGVNLDS